MKLGIPAIDTISLVSVGLQVYAEIPHYEQAKYPLTTAAVSEAIFTQRSVSIDLDSSPQKIAVYDHSKLDHGHSLSGPAIVESDQTTVLVNEGWTLSIDEYRNAILQYEENSK